jgi:AcrR family transcriptional regulator
MSQVVSVSGELSKAAVLERLDHFIGEIEGDERAEKRGRILKAATELFTEHGYRRTSVEAVAERAGVGKGTVYLYFTRKIDLLVAAVALEKRRGLETFAFMFDPDLGAGERLRRYVEAVMLVPVTMPLTGRLWAKEMDAIMDDLPAELVAQSEKDSDTMLGPMVSAAAGDHGWNAHELRDRVDVLVGLVQTGPAMVRGLARSRLSVERFATILSEMVVAGLRRTAVHSNPEAPTDVHTRADESRQGDPQ